MTNMDTIKELTLPEFAWLEGGEHEKDGSPTKGRSIVYHTRSATVLEFFLRGRVFPNDGVPSAEFEYRNMYGVTEDWVVLVHYSVLPDEDQLEEIMSSAIDWYRDYLKWEDKNIAEENTSKLN